MPETEPVTPGFGLNVNDILFSLFRHKWKIVLCAVSGLIAAGVFYRFHTPFYQSDAKLLVRYVLERSAIDTIDSQSGTTGRGSEGVIKAEIEILTSWDLATQVADVIGVERLLPDARGAATKAAAAASIRSGLTVTVPKGGGNVLLVSYQNRDPELARRVLDELVKRYFDEHLKVHRSIGAFDFVTQQTDQVRSRLRQTEEDLKQLKARSGIISLPETMATFNARLARVQEELLAAESERAAQVARVKEMEKWLGDRAPAASPAPAADASPSPTPLQADSRSHAQSAEVHQYKALLESIARLRQSELELLGRYTAESQPVKAIQGQIQRVEARRRELEKKLPALAAANPVTASTINSGPDLLTEKTRLAAAEARIETLRMQLAGLQEQLGRLSDVGAQITELERRRAVEETNYKYFESSLEKARIDEALDPSKIPNISVVQSPSPAGKINGNLQKIVLGLAVGGLAAGVAIALLIDFVLDRSVKRPLELETQLHIPLLLSIPYMNGHRRSGRGNRGNGADHAISAAPALRDRKVSAAGKTRKRRGKKVEAAGADPETAPWDRGHFIRSFSEAIRDRLILGFQLKNLTHKPKLVAVTGLAGGEGTSTVAGGLAVALSETGDGKVLLVDMNVGQPGVHPFFAGQSAGSLADALESGGEATPAASNLYLATASSPASSSSPAGSPARLVPKKFYDMMPNLRASDFDYIIFDMPPLNQGSATLAMAGFMDKVMLLIEAEKNNRHALKRAYTELVAARADVAGVLNKTRSYAPRWLQSQL